MGLQRGYIASLDEQYIAKHEYLDLKISIENDEYQSSDISCVAIYHHINISNTLRLTTLERSV